MSETKIRKCNFCGKDVKVPKDEVRQVYCPTGCLDKYQKHEKIEKMAWEVTLQTIVPTSPKEYTCVPCKVAWEMAEQFYEYAKQKQAKTDV